MREPSPHTPLFGLLAEFDAPERLVEAVTKARAAGLERLDAYTPFPIEGLAEALGFKDSRVPWLTLAGGILGAVLGLGMQVYTNWAYPLDIGGRPLYALPAFMLVVFELMVLFAVGSAIFGMLALNHLPRLHHPLFDVETFHLASSTKFFLVVFGDDRHFDETKTHDFLAALGPRSIARVEHTEEPE